MPYFFSNPNSNVQPFVYWALNFVVSPSFDVVIYLDNVFSNAPTGPISAGPFTLTTTTTSGPTPDKTTLPYKITIPASGNIWVFDNTPIRAGLRSSYLSFLTALENQGLMPGRAAIVEQLLAQYLPLTFTETLYYRYGLDPTNGYVDLQPGMRLRVDFQAHQTIDPSPQNPLNGFVGSGTSVLDVCGYLASSGSLLTGFSPFISPLQRTVVAPNLGGAGGVIDLIGVSFAYPYFRMFYPQNFLSSDSTGFAGSANNVALIGAGSIAAMAQATESYLSTGRVDGSSAVVTFFRGRASLIPQIPVFIQGQPVYLPLGTTIRQALSGYTYIPYISASRPYSFIAPTNFCSRRLAMALSVQTHPQTIYSLQLPGLTPVTLSTTSSGGYQQYTETLDSFDLPLLGGDSLAIPLTPTV